MDIYLKALGASMIGLLITLVLSGTGKDFSLLLGLLICAMVTTVAMYFMEPVMTLIGQLESMIPVESNLLRFLIRITGIGTVGEIAAMICADAGNSAMGKTLQMMTGITILWLALPLMQMLLDLIREIMEGI